MPKADEYTLEQHFRMLANNLTSRAATESAPAQKAEFKRLADCYAELAKRQLPADYFQR